MRAWRIARRAFAAAALTGYGAAQRGGRWNSRGVPVVYASEHRSLALLEILAHIDRREMPDDYRYLSIDVPDDAVAAAGALPRGWDASPHSAATCAIGDRFVAEGTSLALRVPSAIVPDEWNLLINPAHPRFAEVRRADAGAVRFDARVLGRPSGT